ncbi:MAG: copper resistance CopC family protein [Candidatus Rokuibacteriota bacterium]
MTRRLLGTLAVVAVIATVSASRADAHAKLVRADPAPKSVVAATPKIVRLLFNEELAPKGSTVTVIDARGRRVDDGKGRLDLDDLDRRSIIAGLKPLAKGAYTVKWVAVSADDRFVARGTFRFTIR